MIDISSYMKTMEVISKLQHDGKIKKEDITEEFIKSVQVKLQKGIDVEAEYYKKKKRFFFF